MCFGVLRSGFGACFCKCLVKNKLLFFFGKLFLLCAVPKHMLMLRLVGAMFSDPSTREFMVECHLHLMVDCWHVLCSLSYDNIEATESKAGHLVHCGMGRW